MNNAIFSDTSITTAHWSVVALAVGAIAYHNRASMAHIPGLLREAALVAVAYFAYFGVRGLTQANPARALENAGRIEAAERWLHIDWESAWQSVIVGHHSLVTIENWTYIWGHWPVIFTTALWLYLRHPRTYYLFRNAFLISGAIGLVIFATFPVAPPRLASIGVVDTVTEYSRSYRVLQPPAFVNQYAAMPSLHFGWNLLVGIALASVAPRWWLKAAALCIPVLMWFAVILTANHYVIDTAAGATLSLSALGLSWLWSRIRPVREPRDLQRREIGASAASGHAAGR